MKYTLLTILVFTSAISYTSNDQPNDREIEISYDEKAGTITASTKIKVKTQDSYVLGDETIMHEKIEEDWLIIEKNIHTQGKTAKRKHNSFGPTVGEGPQEDLIKAINEWEATINIKPAKK